MESAVSELRPDDPEALLAQSNWLRRLARGLVRDENAAEDLAQDTWVAALRAKPADLRAWMNVVARNFARRSQRDAGLRASHEPRAAQVERVEGPDEIAARVELQRKLAEALLALEEPFRSALVLRYLDGHSTIQVAERLGVSHDAARQRISRGLAKLREKLDHEHRGGRAGWMSALVPFAHVPKASITGGLLLMGTKTKIAVAVLTATFGLWLWKGPLAPTALEPEPGITAVAPLSAETTREVAAQSPLDASKGDSRTEVLIPTIASRIADPAPANVLRGIVLDPKDRPVEGARIVASSSLSYDYQTLDLAIASRSEHAGEARSGADGRFELPLDPARAYQLAVDKPGFAQATLGRRHPGETVTVHLPYGAAIEGRVTQGESKLPVANARVRCFLRGNDSPDGARFEQASVTDAGGNYRIDTLPPGILFLEASATGLPVSDWIEVHPEASKTITQDVNLVAKAWVRGVVLDALTNAPIAGAELSSSWVMRNNATADAQGRFELPLDSRFWQEFYVRAPGYGFRGVALGEDARETGAEGVEVRLAPARRVRGRVLDSNGAPVGGAYVAACASEYGATQRHDWIAGLSDAEGRFDLVDLRPDMQHSLFVRAQGFGSVVYEFPASESADVLVQLPDLVLRPAGSISGMVVDENDHPLPDLKVELRGNNADRGQWDVRGGAFLDTYVGQREGRTDDRGLFTFDELAAGEYQVELRRDSHQITGKESVALRASERRIGVKLVLANGVTLTGRVRDREGKPVRGIYVSIEPTAEGLSDCDVQTGDEGRFSARGIVPGAYRIQLWPPRPNPDDPAAPVFVHTDFPHIQADGREVELVMEDGVWLAGIVLEADGTPVAIAEVSAKEAGAELGSSGLTGTLGRFRIAVARDKSFEIEVRRQPQFGRDERGQTVDLNEGQVNRFPAAVGGGAELRIVMPAR
jgi:RNA polymerase sigma factor (sigma-70 family)